MSPPPPLGRGPSSQSVSSVVQQYCADLCQNVQASFRKATADLEGRSKLSFASMHRSTAGPLLEDAMRNNCIKLNNLEAVRLRLHELYQTMDVDSILQVLESGHTSAAGAPG